MKMPHFPMPSWRQDIKYDLDNIKKLSEILDKPHLRLPPIIHIAGTNGKGSSVATFKSIFEAAGYQVHTYTSPHLLEFNERIVVRGEKISDNYLFQLSERVRIAAEGKVQPTFFEGTTAVAFLAFAEVPADILILETGLGGRFDATNIVLQPLITLITPISYDHKDYLGDSLTDIATEKAGIIKPNVPCVISCQTDEVYQVLLAKCQELTAPAFCYEYDFGLKKTDKGFNYLSNNANYEFPRPSLVGDHQLVNAASVIATIGLINKQFNITNKNIEDGLQNIKWPARIEKIPSTKYARMAGKHVQIWVDGAHNSGGAQVLSSWIADNLSSPIYLILGMTKNRDVEEFCSYFKLLIKRGYGVRVLSEVISYNSEAVSLMASKTGIDFFPADSLEEAIREISNLEQNLERRETNIIITGSLYLAADFFKLIA
jgi:dihydrofolate synthase/folylpolyglutamate synthase